MEFSKHLEFVFRKQRKRKKLSVDFKKEEKFYKDFFFFLIRLSYRYFCAISFWELFAWKVKKREVDFFFLALIKPLCHVKLEAADFEKWLFFLFFLKLFLQSLEILRIIEVRQANSDDKLLEELRISPLSNLVQIYKIKN